MTLLRRPPREIYRVYSEEEYLDGAGPEVVTSIADWHAEGSQLGEGGSVGGWQADEVPGPAGLGSVGDWQAEQPELAIGSDWQLSESSWQGEQPLEQRAGRDEIGRGSGQRVGERSLGRMAGVTMLAATVGAVGVLVCLNLARVQGGSATGRGSLVAATRSAQAGGYPSAAGATRSGVQASRPVVVRPVETERLSRVAQSRRSAGGRPAAHRSDRPFAHLPARRHAGVAVLADYAHRRSAPGEASAEPGSGSVQAPASAPASVSTQAPAPAPVSSSAPAQSAPEGDTTTAAVAEPPAPPAPQKQAEFGFER